MGFPHYKTVCSRPIHLICFTFWPYIAFEIMIADALWGQQFYDYVQVTYDNW